MLILMQI